MRSPIQQYDVSYHCTFCGARFVESSPANLGPQQVTGCDACTVYGAGVGSRVRYGAWTREPEHAAHADRFLTRGAVYTITRVLRWQPHTFFRFAETGTREFHRHLFLPWQLLVPWLPNPSDTAQQ